MTPTIRCCASMLAVVLAALALLGCGEGVLNSPYRVEDAGRNVLYNSFSERLF